MTIPEIRKRLHEIAASLRDPDDELLIADLIDEIDALAEETRRRSNGNLVKAARSTGRWTDEKSEAARALHAAYPEMTMAQIARHFESNNQGRVSEAIYGKRT